MRLLRPIPLHWLAALGLAFSACATADTAATPDRTVGPDSIEQRFANVARGVPYVGDSACVGCHAAAAETYARHSMARSFHAWTPSVRVESTLVRALLNVPTGYAYRVVDSAGALYQVETRPGDTGRPVHELRRRIDYVMGSGRLARTYFTEDNGRLFQLPLTWYADHGWDFSPGYELNNARFSRTLPDRCLACHSSYPDPAPHLEGKYPVLRAGIGCERCHGPGAVHVQARQPMRASVGRVAVRDRGARAHAGAFDSTIVNPARLPLDRRLDVCEQCHVHTSVAVLRERRSAFDFTPAGQLAAQYAFYKNGGDIDLVSHADRLRQSACFVATKDSARPLECASCHNPHAAPPTKATRNQPCLSCHGGSRLAARVPAASRATHTPASDCVSCHMPVVKERTVPHGTFSDHWIRVLSRETPRSAPPVLPIEAYFPRDRSGPEAARYGAMGQVVYAALANDGRAYESAAAGLAPLLGTGVDAPRAHFLLGVAHAQRGRTREAHAAFMRATALDPANPEVLRALAQVTHRLGDTDQALALYVRALALQPALAWVRAEYADVLQQDGQLDAAIAQYRAALREQPSLATGHFTLGRALLAKQQTAEARVSLTEAVRLDPALATALEALIAVRTSGKRVSDARWLASPATAVRAAPPAPGTLGVRVASTSSVQFTNTPPNGFVLVSSPDGTLLLAVPTGNGGTVTWDLRTGEGRPIGAGLYRAEVQARGLVSRPGGATATYFAVVHQ
ncbi:MAG: tetratricopeptide repeat protein [Gemmatimonadaceae bacterium]